MPDRLKRKEELTPPHWIRLHRKRPEYGESRERDPANVDRGLSHGIAIHDLLRYAFKIVKSVRRSAARCRLARSLLPVFVLKGLVHPLLHRQERAYVLITQLLRVNLLEDVLQFGEARGSLMLRSAIGQPSSLG
jgi:hypothetical protein